MPSRLGELRGLIESALAADYEVVSIEAFWALIRAGSVDPGRRYLILRHDIDTDPATAGAIWSLERRLGVRGSYFFRLHTLDLRLMAAMAAAGTHVSYHFEELATVAKRLRLRTADEAIRQVPEAQDSFRRHLQGLRSRTGLPMRVVASHGDYANRKLGIPNWLLLTDPGFRTEMDIDLETYDDAFMRHVSSRHADSIYPRYWEPSNPSGAIARGEPVVYLLIHPRSWQVSRVVNARENAIRLAEGLRYALPAWHRYGAGDSSRGYHTNRLS
jgi:hypothetical protein